MTVRKRFLRITHLLFAVLLLIQFLPSQTGAEEYKPYLLVTVFIAEVTFLSFSAFSKKEDFLRDFGNILSVIYVVVSAWTILVPKTQILDPLIFPAPGEVVWYLVKDTSKLSEGAVSSLKTVFTGYIYALLLGVPMGVILGSFRKVRPTATHIVNFAGAIPPIVFVPYSIALLPSFDTVSKFIIFLSAYWPIMKGTIAGVSSVEKGILDMAKSLSVGTVSLLLHVIIPSALPNIFAGAAQGLGVSFLMLTSAEMIGGQSGIGYYVQYYAKFGDYPRVILGIIILGIIICLISVLSTALQRYFLRWKNS
ncbi:MAG: ABC transporter permease subunit [Oscillospiraceae bacterium]|nr:ABC transporter permease subunit [Oscillospiraceae bacterium]